MARQVPSPLGPFWVWDQDHLGQVLESGCLWDQQLLPFMAEALAARPGTWAIDLGANVGVFTVWLAQQPACAGVIAVEMHPGTCRLLERNVRARDLGAKVSINNVAAYDVPCMMALVEAAQIGWPVPEDLNLTPNASSIAVVPVDADEGFIGGMPIDWLVAPDRPVGLIKVDTQGCDLRALQGLRRTIARCRPLVLFEWEMGASCWHGDTWDKYEQFWAGLDYDIAEVGTPGDRVARPKEGL